MKKKIRFICEKCGTEQKPGKKSDEHWEYYDSKEKCSCGGKFIMEFEGKLLTKKNKFVYN